MKHVLEFTYDGFNRWAINDGIIVGPSTVQSYIGREAFFEALKFHNSFRVIMEIKIEPIE